MKVTNANISKAVRNAFHVVTEFQVFRSPAGYFYANCTARIDGVDRILDVESEYTFSLAQRSFESWVGLWTDHVRAALERAS